MAVALATAGCPSLEEHRVGGLVDRSASPRAFLACHGHGCYERTKIRLSEVDWLKVRSYFRPAAADAATERRQVAAAIGQIETYVGRQAGTATDVGRNAVFARSNAQLDCVDEAVNTTTYLRMLAGDHLLRRHQVASPAGRGLIINGRLPHNTAVLRQLDTGDLYAIDSWFFANGHPAAVVPLEAWKRGWSPGEDGQEPHASALAQAPPSQAQ